MTPGASAPSAIHGFGFGRRQDWKSRVNLLTIYISFWGGINRKFASGPARHRLDSFDGGKLPGLRRPPGFLGMLPLKNNPLRPEQ